VAKELSDGSLGGTWTGAGVCELAFFGGSPRAQPASTLAATPGKPMAVRKRARSRGECIAAQSIKFAGS
jgi:hypothetical protein